MRDQEPQLKSKPLAFLLWALCFAGFAGIHRFYLGKYVTGIIWLLTWGLVGIGQLIDLFLISDRVDIANSRISVRHMKMTGRIPGERSGARVQHGRTPPPLMQTRKRCPDCAEFIQAKAKSCRFCGADLTVVPASDGPTTFCDCPECKHLLEVPNHLIGVPGNCIHCGEVITPQSPATGARAEA